MNIKQSAENLRMKLAGQKTGRITEEQVNAAYDEVCLSITQDLSNLLVTMGRHAEQYVRNPGAGKPVLVAGIQGVLGNIIKAYQEVTPEFRGADVAPLFRTEFQKLLNSLIEFRSFIAQVQSQPISLPAIFGEYREVVLDPVAELIRAARLPRSTEEIDSLMSEVAGFVSTYSSAE